MEPLGSQDVHSSAVTVQQYLQDVEPSWTGVEMQSHLAQLSSECILLFQIMLKTLRASRKAGSEERRLLEISLERSYGRMKIWSDENGAADGTLDAKLEGSRDLHHDTRKYVVSISQALSERLVNVLDVDLGNAGYASVSVLRSLTAAFAEGDSDASSDSGFSDTSTGSVNGILEDLRVDTTCLLDLEPLLCSPLSREDLEPAAVLDSTRVKWSSHQPYSDKISVRFPMAADELVARLGQANYERYLRCQEQKATNDLGEILSDQTASSLPDAASSKFHDSGIGSSLPTAGSAYAETVMSYGAGEGRRVRVPPLPARAKEGLPFVCVACGKWVTIATNSAWKQHVYEDLEPWICLEAGCAFTINTFSTRKDWIAHLSCDHGTGSEWRMIQCPLCRVDVGPGKLLITRHISDHLEEISLSALPADCEFDDESEGSENDEEGEDIEKIEGASDLQDASEERGIPTTHNQPDPMNEMVGTASLGTMYVRALYDYEAEDRAKLSFHEGDVIQVITELESGWWDGVTNGVRGWFPSNFCQTITSPDEVLNSEKQDNGFGEPLDDEKSRLSVHEELHEPPKKLSTEREMAPTGRLWEQLGGRIESQAAIQTNRELEASKVSPPSSYWSVGEMNKFPELLQSFGTDWQAIAQHLTTKTATMVKNFYSKQTGRERPEWVQIASEADQKLQRGEKLPAPPPKPAGGRGFRTYSTPETGPDGEVTAVDQSACPLCPICRWRPDTSAGNRSFRKLREAVERHFRRNHKKRDLP